jgi:SPP1 family predicted phage head-tail adaptor
MRIGELNKRIIIGRYASGENEWGDPLPEPVWETVAEVWASVVGLSGSQYFQAQQTVNQSDHKMIIRYRTDIKQGMIVRHDGREFTIHAVLDEDGKRRWLTLSCKEEEPT